MPPACLTRATITATSDPNRASTVSASAIKLSVELESGLRSVMVFHYRHRSVGAGLSAQRPASLGRQQSPERPSSAPAGENLSRSLPYLAQPFRLARAKSSIRDTSPTR